MTFHMPRPRLLIHAALVVVGAAVFSATGIGRREVPRAAGAGRPADVPARREHVAHARVERQGARRSRAPPRSPGTPCAGRRATSSSSRRVPTSSPTTRWSGPPTWGRRRRRCRWPSRGSRASLRRSSGACGQSAQAARRAGARRRRSTCAGPAAERSCPTGRPRLRPLEHRRGRDRLPGVVPERPGPEDVLDDHERRRRARVLPAGQGPLRPRPLARPRRAHRLRRSEERPADRVVRAVEPGLQVGRSGPGARPRRSASSRRCRTSSRPRAIAKPHTLVPAFAVDGTPTTPEGLYRVYVFTDRDCVNRVFTGSRSRARPTRRGRTAGQLALPAKH